MGLRNNTKLLLFFHTSVWHKHIANDTFCLNYIDWSHWLCFVRCHHTLSDQQTKVVTFRAGFLCIGTKDSRLIITKPPKTQHEACHIIVFKKKKNYCVGCKKEAVTSVYAVTLGCTKPFSASVIDGVCVHPKACTCAVWYIRPGVLLWCGCAVHAEW